MYKELGFKEYILKLIDYGDEGSYYDYKECFPQNNGDLVLDILCMANNLEHRDAYILFGVSDSGEIVGIEQDENRKNKQNITDLLRQQTFAGDCRPKIDIVTLEVGEKKIDVLIVMKSRNVPFYLKTKYKQVNPYQIYTRVGDTNTPSNSEADINDVEKLWKIRFGLHLNPLERIESYIEDKESWRLQQSTYSETSEYYQLFPEFTIVEKEDDGNRNKQDFAYVQTSTRSSYFWIQVKYHQTLLREILGYYIDETRAQVTMTELGHVANTKNVIKKPYHNGDLAYEFYLQNTLDYKIISFINKSKSENYSLLRHFEYVPVFKDVEEKKKLDVHIQTHLEGFKSDVVSEYKETKLMEANLDNEIYIKSILATSKSVVNWLEKMRIEACMLEDFY